MSRKNHLSRKAAMAKGALAVFLTPKLALDQKIDLNPILIGVTASNWLTKKPSIVASLNTAVKGKLAQDANIEDVLKLLDSLDGEELGEKPDGEELGEKPDDNLGTDEDSPLDKIRAFLKGKVSDSDIDEIGKLMEVAGSDDLEVADPEGDEPAALIARLKTLLESLSKEPDAADAPPPTPGTPAPPVSSNKSEEPMNKPAMDKALKAAVQQAEINTMQRMRDIAAAEKAVRPLIGDIIIAQDSAEAVYRLALETNGVDVKGIHPSAFKAMTALLPLPGSTVQISRRIAQDSGSVVDFQKRFPGASNVRNLG